MWLYHICEWHYLWIDHYDLLIASDTVGSGVGASYVVGAVDGDTVGHLDRYIERCIS